LREAAAEAARADVRILSVGVGTEAGSTIPDHEALLRDPAGELVRSRRDLARLAALAEGTGGRLLATDAFGALDAVDARREIRRDAASAPGETVERRVAAVRVAPFAALAFALLAAELAFGALAAALVGPLSLPSQATRRRSTLPALSTLLVLLLAAPPRSRGAEPDGHALAGIPALEAAAAREPRDPTLLLRLGLARARAGLGPEAERAFLAAALYARDPGLASLAYFDLGVTALERGALERARDAFLDTLALSPADGEARFNLEWTLRALQEAPPPRGAESPSGAEDPRAGAADDERPGGAETSTERGARGGQGPHSEPDAGSGAPTDNAPEAAAGDAPQAAPLDAADTARWLHAVQDDPGRGLRDAARRAGGGERPPAQAPGW
jgi:tetratricopeptide (TPR) repeat protein